MSKEKIFDIICNHAREVLPALSAHQFQWGDALKDLGANSIDRSEILMMTLEELSLRVPMVTLAGASNLGELAELLYEKSKG